MLLPLVVFCYLLLEVGCRHRKVVWGQQTGPELSQLCLQLVHGTGRWCMGLHGTHWVTEGHVQGGLGETGLWGSSTHHHFPPTVNSGYTQIGFHPHICSCSIFVLCTQPTRKKAGDHESASS